MTSIRGLQSIASRAACGLWAAGWKTLTYNICMRNTSSTKFPVLSVSEAVWPSLGKSTHVEIMRNLEELILRTCWYLDFWTENMELAGNCAFVHMKCIITFWKLGLLPWKFKHCLTLNLFFHYYVALILVAHCSEDFRATLLIACSFLIFVEYDHIKTCHLSDKNKSYTRLKFGHIDIAFRTSRFYQVCDPFATDHVIDSEGCLLVPGSTHVTGVCFSC